MNYLESLFSLEGKVAVVTGAARGNGKAITGALLKAGASVVLVDLLKDELSETTEMFRSRKLKAVMYHCDITRKEELDSLLDFLVKEFKAVDILINNAGVSFGHSLFDYPEEDWEKTYKVNLKAPFELSKRIAWIMKGNDSGVIINITSLNSELAFPDNPAYVTFKGALKQLSKSLAMDLGKYGIRVNNVGPGYIKSDMTLKSWNDPELNRKRTERTILGRWGEPEDLEGVIVFLCSKASSYITGQDIYVDGGWLIKGL